MLAGLEILELRFGEVSPAALRAQRFAALLAQKMGARVFSSHPQFYDDSPFYSGEVHPNDEDPAEWGKSCTGACAVLMVGEPGFSKEVELPDHLSAVFIELEAWQNECSLFALSALSDLLGDPEQEPLVPQAHYAAHSIGYAAYAALTSLFVKHRRFGASDQAVVNGQGVLSWVNWKAGAAGAMGQDISRQGKDAEWPVISCKDGFAAFVYTERDWKALTQMIGDPALDDERFRTFALRNKNRDAYMAIIRDWAAERSKAEIAEAMYEHAVPGAAVTTPEEMVRDPLLAHRGTFEITSGGSSVPRPAYRVLSEAPGATAASDETGGALPLDGIRVLDLGIITAGAGVSAVLADLGAEVLKVESSRYPDPFRQWAGEDVSPLFKFNNRNKYGVGLDLKTDEGRAQFLVLVKGADVVLENFRRGVMDRLGLDFETLRQANPRLLLASISGQGADGPLSDHTTFGSTLEASSGFAALTSYEDGIPVISGRNLNYPDQIVCLYGAAVVTAAVQSCREDGVARHIDISQRDCAIYQIGDVVAAGGSVRHDEEELPPEASWLKGSEMFVQPVVKQAGIFARSPAGDLVKGFAFQFVKNPMTIRLNSPEIGEHTERFVRLQVSAGDGK